jgi:hypothetical protein
MADNGSITLRLAIAGAPEVKAALASLGPAGASALRQIEQAQAGPTAGMLALNAAGKDLNAGLANLAGNAGTVGSAFSAMGPAGLAAAAGIGAMVAAGTVLVQQTKQAMDFAEALETAATKAGIGTTALQEYRYAGSQVGLTFDQVDTSIGRFTQQLGLAEAGQPRALKIFQSIGFTQDQLKSFDTVDQALDAVVAKVADLGNTAETAGIAKRLGLGDLAPLLDQGAEKIANLRAEAVSLGVVMDGSTVKALADAEKGFKSASEVIDVQFKSALVDIAPLLVAAINLIAQAARMLNDFVNQFKDLQNRSSQAIVDDLHAKGPQLELALAKQKSGDITAQPDVDRLTSEIHSELAELHSPHRQDTGAPLNNNGNTTVNLANAGRGRQGPTEDEITRNSAQAIDQGQQDDLKAQKDLLDAELALTTDVQQRAALQAQIADLEAAEAQTARDKKIASEKLLLEQGKITQAAYDQFIASEAKAQTDELAAAAAKKELQARQEAQALADQANALAEGGLEAQIAMVQAQLPLTATMKDRATLALKLFDLEEHLAELKLEEVIASKTATQAEKDKAQQALDSLKATAPDRRQATATSNPTSPWDQWKQQALQDGKAVNDQLESIATHGLDDLNQGLADAIANGKNMGDVLVNVFKQMEAALIQYLLKQAEIGLVGGGVGGGGGGIFGFLGGLFGLGGGGFGAGVGAFSGASAGAGSLVAALGFAGGGRVSGPGGPTDDRILAYVSNGETVMTAKATSMWGPLLDAMNGNHASLPRFAAGGMVGGGHGANSVRLGGDTYVVNADHRIYAEGADPAALARVENAQRQQMRNEPQRFAGYFTEFKRQRLI